MKIRYDNSLKIAGIGLIPWRRLGPEQWFPNYVIASLYDDGGVDSGIRVVAASHPDSPVRLPKRNTHALLANTKFQALLDQELAGYDLMLYKAATVPNEVSSRRILMPSANLALKYENKVQFRRMFADIVPLAPFEFVSFSALQGGDVLYQMLIGKYAQGFVIQDARLSGGQGTYVIRGKSAFDAARTSLLARGERDDPYVVSGLVDVKHEFSIQGCITKDAVYTGPLQRQILRDPLLSPDIPGVSGFDGIQIFASDQGTAVHEQATQYARQIAGRMQADGYRGIFGIDLMQAQDGSVFVLEINPRITGATPLLSALYRGDEGVPFYLLHILELGGYDYEVLDASADFQKSGALLVLHSLYHEPMQVTELPSAGTYRVERGELEKVSANLLLNELRDNEFIVLPQIQVGETANAGGMLASVQFRGEAIDEKYNKLYNEVITDITAVRSKIKLV